MIKYFPWLLLTLSISLFVVITYGAFVLPMELQQDLSNGTPSDPMLESLARFSGVFGWPVYILCLVLFILAITLINNKKLN